MLSALHVPLSNERSVVLGPAVHPIVNVASEEPPVLPDFGGRQFAQTRELIHRGFRHTQKPRDVRDGENLAFRRRYTIEADVGCGHNSVVHNGYGIGGRHLKL